MKIIEGDTNVTQAKGVDMGVCFTHGLEVYIMGECDTGINLDSGESVQFAQDDMVTVQKNSVLMLDGCNQ